MSNLYYDEIDSPIGVLLVVFHGDDIVRIDYGTMEIMEQRLKKWTERYFTEPVFIKSPDKAAPVKRDFDDYFNGESKAFSFPFTFHGTPFQKQVWQVLYDGIPYGKTTTYKDIAIKIQNPKAVRAVGGAVNKNPLSIVVPCHRVIGSSGKMVGYNGGLDKKEYLLTFEKNNAS
ncbi:methylated-DNA--[protein]-cysteine S-methyltransferase [Virgibacillus alimentarius]|uniref:methylated-DNA--[protein]-cysteine S-methyltransferase n=1 Tax=Virgibacillus alimentarius TaxID=698769 RepID=UPI0004931EDD|nr:methylated-DNA--[protein]-cysteine S-methyltransferase [Virgibacillus alimentarius]